MNKRLSKERQSLVLAALCEGTPINAVCRMFRADKAAVLRVIRETGEAFADYMDANFRDLPCSRIELDEQWQYVGCHSGRMIEADKERGDFGFGRALTQTQSLFCRIASGNAIGGQATVL